MKCEVNLQIKTGWVGPTVLTTHPTMQAGGDASGTIALWALKFLWWVTGSSSVRLGVYHPRSSGGGSTKAILLSWGGIVVVFEMVV